MKRFVENDPVAPPPTRGWYDDDCWVYAVATFFGIGHAAAYRLIARKRRPPKWSNLGIPTMEFFARIKELGLRELGLGERAHYERTLRRNAIVLVRWDVPGFDTAHLVVWDWKRKRRIDICGRDTLATYRSHVVAVFVRE